MKKIVMIVLLLSVGMIAMAQSKEEKKVADAVEQLRKAMVDADSSTLAKLTMPLLSYGHSSGLIENKQEYIHKIVSGASDFESIDLTNQTISVSGSTAWVRHTLSGTTNDNGRKGSVKLHVLTVWQKDHGNWKLLARQAVRVP